MSCHGQTVDFSDGWSWARLEFLVAAFYITLRLPVSCLCGLTPTQRSAWANTLIFVVEGTRFSVFQCARCLLLSNRWLLRRKIFQSIFHFHDFQLYLIALNSSHPWVYCGHLGSWLIQFSRALWFLKRPNGCIPTVEEAPGMWATCDYIRSFWSFMTKIRAQLPFS